MQVSASILASIPSPPRSVIEPSSPPVAGSRPIEVLPTANAAPSGTQMASADRIMSGHGSGAGFGRTSSASQSGTTAARTAAARVLIWARLRSSLIVSNLLAVDLSTERPVVTAPGPRRALADPPPPTPAVAQ